LSYSKKILSPDEQTQFTNNLIQKIKDIDMRMTYFSGGIRMISSFFCLGARLLLESLNTFWPLSSGMLARACLMGRFEA
jgi:dihydrodipicolinate synthase/N-acetylneuraminate lyase